MKKCTDIVFLGDNKRPQFVRLANYCSSPDSSPCHGDRPGFWPVVTANVTINAGGTTEFTHGDYKYMIKHATFMHVSDAARAVSHVIKMSDVPHNVFNVGDPALAYTKREICDLVSEYTPFEIVENSFGVDIDQRDYAVSYDRIMKTGFSCEKVLDSQIEMIMNYYKSRFNSGYLNG